MPSEVRVRTNASVCCCTNTAVLLCVAHRHSSSTPRMGSHTRMMLPAVACGARQSCSVVRDICMSTVVYTWLGVLAAGEGGGQIDHQKYNVIKTSNDAKI